MYTTIQNLAYLDRQITEIALLNILTQISSLKIIIHGGIVILVTLFLTLLTQDITQALILLGCWMGTGIAQLEI
jgi:hypothetical protein